MNIGSVIFKAGFELGKGVLIGLGVACGVALSEPMTHADRRGFGHYESKAEAIVALANINDWFRAHDYYISVDAVKNLTKRHPDPDFDDDPRWRKHDQGWDDISRFKVQKNRRTKEWQIYTPTALYCY